MAKNQNVKSELDVLSDERARDLAAIEAQVESEQGASVGQPVGAGEAAASGAVDAVAMSLGDELAGLMSIAVSLLSPAFPSLKKIYTDDTVLKVSKALESVCIKRGWLQSGLMDGYSVEISAAFVVLPVGIATYNGVKADIAEKQAAKVVKSESVGA